MSKRKGDDASSRGTKRTKEDTNAPLWTPSSSLLATSNWTKFTQLVNDRFKLSLETPQALWKWSVDNLDQFWEACWDFTGMVSSQSYTKVIEDKEKMPGAKFFVGARLNFAENLLRYRDERPAIIFKSETSNREETFRTRSCSSVWRRYLRGWRGWGLWLEIELRLTSLARSQIPGNTEILLKLPKVVVIIYGRSDATLKLGGVRIGTADIYKVLEWMEEVEDLVVVGQNYTLKDGTPDVRIFLFLVMVAGYESTSTFQKKVRQRIRDQASPRHMPSMVVACPAIPHTVSGKKVELTEENHRRPRNHEQERVAKPREPRLARRVRGVVARGKREW